MFQTLPLQLASPLLLLAVAAVAWRRPGTRPGPVPRLSEWAASASLVFALAGVAQLLASGPATLAAFDGPLRLALRFDAVSAAMALLVAFIGWVVMRYSRSYLDGDEREGAFHGTMAATLAAVLVLVHAASLAVVILAFFAVGRGVRRLLLHYPGRPAAKRAAAKFALVWHAGDLTLLLAAASLWSAFGSADFAVMTGVAALDGLTPAGHVAVALLVVTAALKTASFPVHGWLTEVMEAPTPVSALLHAGIINAGGLLLIRMAEVVQASPGSMAALVMLGGLTALFGAVVMLTQSAVKTALAWSTVAQMGFMLMQCGLGLWPLALLHIVAHSLYKAHAFLSAGGAVGAVTAVRRPGPVAVPGAAAVGRAFVLALLLYAAVAGAFVLAGGAKTPQALALGAMLIFGVAYLVAQGLADAAPAALTRRTALAATAAAIAYFAFQDLAALLWAETLPPAPAVGPREWGLIGLAVSSFGVVAVAQTLFPLWAHHPAAAGLRVHLANGLYLNALLDRLIGGFRLAPRD